MNPRSGSRTSTSGAAAARSRCRDIAYLSERLRSAEVVPPPAAPGVVAFGSRVSLQRGDGRRQVFSIVGEDEADPRAGSISYVSPMARALLGKSVGDVAAIGNDEIAILAVA